MQLTPGITRRTVVKTLGAGMLGGVTLAGGASADGGELTRDLAEARAATAAYSDPANAYADGYTATDLNGNPVALDDVQEEALAICGMGYHFLNFEIIGGIYGEADPERRRPPILVYGVGDDGDLVLGAVEYLAEDPDPDFFHGSEDDSHWEPWPPDTALSALHAWVHNHNPAGVFHSTNPRQQFHPDGCIGGH